MSYLTGGYGETVNSWIMKSCSLLFTRVKYARLSPGTFSRTVLEVSWTRTSWEDGGGAIMARVETSGAKRIAKLRNCIISPKVHVRSS